jgi:hypothetical protein
MSNAFFVNWDDPVVQLELMAEGPSQRFIDYAMNEAMFMATRRGQRVPHPTMEKIFRLGWISQSPSEENRRYLILSQITASNPERFAAFYHAILTKFDEIYEGAYGNFFESRNSIMEEIGKVADGSPPDAAISRRDWNPTLHTGEFRDKLVIRSYEMARSLLEYRPGNFLVDIRDGIVVDAVFLKHRNEIPVVDFAYFFDKALKDHFPDPPNLTTLKFE